MARAQLANYYIKRTGTTLQDCTDVADFQVAANAGSSAVNSLLYYGGCIKMNTPPSSTHVHIQDVASINFNGKDVVSYSMQIYVPTHADVAGNVQFYVSDNALSRYYWKIMGLAHQGYNHICVSAKEMSAFNSIPSWDATMNAIRFRLNGAANERTIYLGGIYANYYSRPKVVITFDDGWASAYDEGFVYANAAGIPTTYYIIPGRIGTASYMTQSNLDAIYSTDSDLGVHADNSWPSHITQSSIAHAILEEKNWLIANGYTRAAMHACYPGGQYGQTEGNYSAVVGAMGDAGMDTAVVIQQQAQAYHQGIEEPYKISRMILDSSYSLTTIKARITEAIQRGTSVFLMGHKLETSAGSNTWAIADWQALIDWIADLSRQGLIDPCSISKWYDGMDSKHRRRLL